MATSGSKSVTVTSWDTLKFSWSQKSQSVENNTTTIDWKMELIATSSGRIVSSVNKAWSVTINGKTTTGTSSVAIFPNVTKTLASGTATIPHNSDGTKSFSYSFIQTFDISFSDSWIGTKSGSGTGTLNTIPRKSSMSVSSGTLGTPQTLTVTRQSSSFTHSIKAVCGKSTLYIKADGSTSTSEVKHSDCSIEFKPPFDWAKQNTAGTSVSVTYTIITYNGSSNIGSNTKTVSYSIPTDVKPSCSIAVTDPTGIATGYGDYIKGLSKFKIAVTPTLAYDSPIATYKTTVNGVSYTKASFTTDVINKSGTITIATTITDKRGRTASVSMSISVIDYALPSISRLSVKRCENTGTEDEPVYVENDQGEYIGVTFSANVTGLDDRNGSEYYLQYKKAGEGVYETIDFNEDYGSVYSVTDVEYFFEADTGSSYDVKIIVRDDFNEVSRVTTASTAYTLMNWNALGNAMGIGKVAEIQNVLDIGMQTRFYGGILNLVLEPETDLNDITTPNTYIGENVSTYKYINCPIDSGTFTFEVFSAGVNGQVLQRLTRCDKIKPVVFQRYWYGGSWGHWFWAGNDEVLLYENESGSSETVTMTLNNDGQQEISASHFRYLEIYFTDNNNKTGGYTKVWQPNGKSVCLQITEPSSTIYSRQTLYTISGQKVTPSLDTASYYRITSAGAVSTSIGTNYIKIVRIVGRA